MDEMTQLEWGTTSEMWMSSRVPKSLLLWMQDCRRRQIIAVSLFRTKEEKMNMIAAFPEELC